MKKSVFIALFVALAVVGWVASGLIGDGPATGNAAQVDHGPATPTAPSAAIESGDQAAADEVFAVRVVDSVERPYQMEAVLRGRTEASRSIALASEIDGVVADILVARGAFVSEGQLLLTMDIDAREAHLAEAQALVAQREAEYGAEAQLAHAGYAARNAQALALANLDAARAYLVAAELAIDDTRITAPFDGVLEERPAELGMYVSRGEVLARLVDLDPILVVGHVTERLVGGVRVGATGVGRLVSGQEVEGVVRFVSQTADPQTRTFRVELEVANPDNAIRDGVSAELRIPVGERMAHLIPRSALTLDDAGALGVRAVDADGRVAFHAVEIVADAADGMWIAGPPPRMRLITVGQEYVGEGEIVRVAPVEAADAADAAGGEEPGS